MRSGFPVPPRATAHGRQIGFSGSKCKSVISDHPLIKYATPHNSPITLHRKPLAMDRKEIAKKIREAIFNRIEEDRAIHASSIEQEVEKVLSAMSIGHQAARGASAPIPTVTPCVGSHRWLEELVPPGVKPGPRRCGDCGEAESAPVPKTHTLTLDDCRHTFTSTGGVLKKPDAWPPASVQRYPVIGDTKIRADGKVYMYSGSLAPGVEQWMDIDLAQVEIITHPEAADK